MFSKILAYNLYAIFRFPGTFVLVGGTGYREWESQHFVITTLARLSEGSRLHFSRLEVIDAGRSNWGDMRRQIGGYFKDMKSTHHTWLVNILRDLLSPGEGWGLKITCRRRIRVSGPSSRWPCPHDRQNITSFILSSVIAPVNFYVPIHLL